MIAHIDMDAFFVEVEKLKNPSLKGKAVALGHNSPRSVLSTASYEARKFGVHSGMPVYRALQLCPELILVSGRMEEYSYYSKKIKKLCHHYSDMVTPASIDEFYLHLSGKRYYEQKYGSRLKAMANLQSQVKETLGLPCSIGLASTGMIAKMAVKTVKPFGLIELDPGNSSSWLKKQKLSDIPGIGPKAKKELDNYSLYIVADLLKFYKVNKFLLYQNIKLVHALQIIAPYYEAELNETASIIFKSTRTNKTILASASDKTKSFSNERTFSNNCTDAKELDKWILILAEKVSRRLRKHHYKGKTISVKVRIPPFQTSQFSKSFSCFVNNKDIFLFTKTILKKYGNSPIRLLGIKVSNLTKENEIILQEDMFANLNNAEVLTRENKNPKYDLKNNKKKEDTINTVLDKLKDKFGEKIIRKGGEL